MPYTSPEAMRDADASHAIGQYLTRGPSMPYSAMKVVGLEGVRSRLKAAANPDAMTEEACGWAAIEQAFVLAEGPHLPAHYALEPLFAEAEESFTNSLDLYDEAIDRPEHPWRIELALGALPLYEMWVNQQVPTHPDVRLYHETVLGVGHKLLTIREEEGDTWDSDTAKNYGGFVSELVVQLAYGRRRKDGFSGEPPSFVVPSTMRQNYSSRPGSNTDRYNQKLLRGNWDVSVVEYTAGRLALTDKLQVKTILVIPDRPKYGTALQRYTEDVTIVAAADHVCRGRMISSSWEPLAELLDASVPRPPRQQKQKAQQMSRELEEHLRWSRQRRAEGDGTRLHEYNNSKLKS